MNKLMASPSYISYTTSTANAIGTVTITGKAGFSIYILGITISASAAPAAAVTALLKDGTTTILPLEIPASAFAPIVIGFGTSPIRISAGANAVLTIPALGGTTVSSGTIRYVISSI